MLRRAGHPWAEERHPSDEDRGPAKEQSAPVQRSAVPGVLRSSGRPLDSAVRRDMEARLGADFSDVRIHDDSAAKASAAEVGARAYTSGSHVVLGDGGGDEHTLAHELTHVIQQRHGPVAGTDNGAGLKVSDPSDRFEREAEANAVRVMQRRVVSAEQVLPAEQAPEPAARAMPHSAVPIQRVRDPEKEAFARFEHEVKRIAARPDVDAESFSPEIEKFLEQADRATRAARIKEARTLIDGLPDYYADESVNAAHAALDRYDHARPALAVPGAEYVSASQVTDPVGNGYIHRDIPGVVIIEKEPYVPVYSAVFGDALRDAEPKHKDIGQDEHGLVQIHTGDPSPDEQVLWVSIGQPLRQLKWLDKYKIRGKAASPMIRSFLVPLRVANDISRGAITEHNSGGRTEDLNVDKHFAANQFGIRDPQSLESLRKFALPGSLRTYTDSETAGTPESWGDTRETGELRDKLGVPREAMPEFPVFTDKDGEFLSHSKYKDKTSELRRIVAAHTNTPALLEEGETMAPKRVIDDFFSKNAPDELKQQAAPGKKAHKIAVDTFVKNFVVPWAAQARIAEVVYQGFDDFKLTNAKETPSNYRLTEEEPTLRGERRTEAIALGEDQRELMDSRKRIRQMFDSLDFAQGEVFKEADAAGSGVRKLVGQLHRKRAEILSDYKFKIGDRNTLLSKNPEYAVAAADFRDRLSAVLPRDLGGFPKLKAVFEKLDGFESAP